MNINIPNLNESSNKSPLTERDLFAYIDSVFPDKPSGWKQATLEIVDMANWIYEEVLEECGQDDAHSLRDTSKSKTPKEWNLKHKMRIKTGFVLLSSEQQKRFFERFSDWINSWKNNSVVLNESQQIKIEDEKEIEDVLKFKQNQFTFESGIFMGTIPCRLETKFGLLWHALQTKDMNEFVSSVSDFIASSKESLTELDIEKLENHYIKYFTE